MPRPLQYDRILCGTILSLMFFGVLMVFSATAGGPVGSLRYVIKQLIAVAAGLAAMRWLMYFDYRQLRHPKLVFAVLGTTVVLLAVALFGAQTANTHRFLRVGDLFSVQPSELAKLALVLFLAYYLEKRGDRFNDWRTLGGAALIVGVLCLLVLGGRDLGSVILLVAISGALFWAAGLEIRYFLLAAAAVVPLVGLAIWSEPYRMKRILIFLNPESDPLNAGFQILQSEIAVGTGGLFGQGLMQGRQKMRFLPEADTDFIFAVIGEELGLLGACLVVLAFGIILWRGLLAARHATDRFGCYLAVGMTAMIVCQAMINLGVVLAMLPTKGLPLPFISYGGTAMLTALAGSGVLLNVSQHRS